MMELDFTALDQLAYRGIDTPEEQVKKDALIERGFTIEEGGENPFLQASETASDVLKLTGITNPSTALERPAERKIEASTAPYSTRNYKPLYRAAHDYHTRHSPPKVEMEYWRKNRDGDTPQTELDYWVETAQDMGLTSKAFGNDLFLMGLLKEIYLELEREYKRIKGEAQGNQGDY